MAKEEQNQDKNLDVILNIFKNFVETGDKTIPLKNNNKLEIQLIKNLNFDDNNNNEKLMPLLKKSKWVLVNNF